MKKDQIVQALIAAMLGLIMWQAEGERQRNTEFRTDVKAEFTEIGQRLRDIETYWQRRTMEP